jgi:hypothetical protein
VDITDAAASAGSGEHRTAPPRNVATAKDAAAVVATTVLLSSFDCIIHAAFLRDEALLPE